MKRFLSKMAVWALALILTAWALESVQSRRSTKTHPTNLILGDSHAGPVKMKTFANLSHAADPLFVQILKAFRHGDMTGAIPKYVTVTVGPHNFSALSELRIRHDHENWRSSSAARLASVGDAEAASAMSCEWSSERGGASNRGARHRTLASRRFADASGSSGSLLPPLLLLPPPPPPPPPLARLSPSPPSVLAPSNTPSTPFESTCCWAQPRHTAWTHGV